MGSVTGERRCLTDRDGRALRTAPGRCPCDRTPEHPTGFVSLPPRLTPATWAGSSGQGGVRSLDFRTDEQTPTHYERHVRRSGGGRQKTKNQNQNVAKKLQNNPASLLSERGGSEKRDQRHPTLPDIPCQRRAHRVDQRLSTHFYFYTVWNATAKNLTGLLPQCGGGRP